ncbi:GNAT family N-acetyltransferase [Tissierella pigra]|uniref:GNAT family N-acetyltransferase n=1 Tax=Tissierella pigra TaxID=2607614 RepID=A0A6N7XJC1_9FIRM|nr:GNAT family protein [Tissierella pigra]MSU00862.1 GNAT family N-acetyltransferase [Tissierella pigra]
MFKHIIDNDIELRLVNVQYAEEIFKSIDSSRKHLRKYLPWVDTTKSAIDTRAFIDNSKRQYAENKGFDAGIWYKGEFAGVIGFHNINPSIKGISIGYWLNERFVGKGIMTKACRVFVDYAFNTLELNRVEIRCAEDNFKSGAIPERLGFTKEGIIRDGELLCDGYVNSLVYGILKREWK